MDAVFASYLDQSFLDFVSSLVALVPAGIVLAVLVFLVGWVVSWFIRLVNLA